jgi:serine/threonine protein kinase
MMMIGTAKLCPKCGAEIPNDAPEGGCPGCLLESALRLLDDEAVVLHGRDDRVADEGVRPGENSGEDGSDSLVPADGRFGIYEIERRPDGSLYELGRGGMGVTYRAVDTSLQRKVALKIIKAGIARRSGDARERFLREARAAAALRHENIATVYQFGIREDTGQYFYAMELIEGETLEERVRRAGQLSVRITIDIAQQVTAALAVAEKHGLLHRDLKPANLMLVSPDGETVDAAVGNEKVVVKIIDFGLAKALHAPGHPLSLTRGGFVGTPEFASPEQFEHSSLDVRSDIYSLGATLWFALTGSTPFAGHKVEEVHSAQKSDALPIEQLKAARVPSRLRSLLESMLAFEPAARPGTQELAAELRRCTAEARGERRAGISLAAAAILLLGAAAFSIFWSLSMEHRSAAVTEKQPLNLAVPEKSIAVLPFENRSEQKQNAYFADGVQDEILTDLARVADLKVISRTSVLTYKSGVARNLREIAQQLGVANVVEGSVQRSGNRVRVNAQLVDARNDTHLWAQTYDRDLADVFAIQSEIAKAIADQLQARLSPAEKNTIEQRPTADVVAFEEYSKAKTLMLVAGGGGTIDRALREAVDLLKSAIARDPAFHAAFCQLVLANDRLYSLGYDHTPERLSAVEEALKKAAELRPDSAATHLARAQHFYYGLRDYNGALAELDLARQGLPNDPRVRELTGYILRRQGKFEEGLHALQQAASLDPRNTSLLQQIGVSYSGLRRYGEAAATFDRALQIKPDDVPLGVLRTHMDLEWRADPDPMCRFVERVRRERPESLPHVVDNWFECSIAKRDWAHVEQALAASGDNSIFPDGPIVPNRDFGEGLLARAMHDEARARRAFTNARAAQEQVVQKQKDYGPALCLLGLIDAALGNKKAALDEGRRATELLPISKDAINGSVVSAYFAMTAAWAGETDLAIEQLSAVVQPGVYAPLCTHYGMLEAFPFWDPLRSDPRFEQIVASLAPKNASP